MKSITYVVFTLILILLYGGCSGGNGGIEDNVDTMTCFPNAELVNSECLAEDLLNVCNLFFCGTTVPTEDPDLQIASDFLFPPDDCVAAGCSAIDCMDSRIFSDLGLNDNLSPSGLVEINGFTVDLFCF